jgi:hypothetical protein
MSATGGLDVQVDLRSAWTAVRDQGLRSSCLACTASDAHAFSHGRDRPLSVEFLFFHAGQKMPGKNVASGLTFAAVDGALQAEGQPDDAEWPYAMTQPDPWEPPAVSRRWYGRLASAAGTIEAIVQCLKAQQPVVLGVRLTAEFIALNTLPYVIPASGHGFGGHAVLAVGLAQHPEHGSLLLVRNSWGPNWGDGGYGWLCADYLIDNLIGDRVVSPIRSTIPNGGAT